MRNNSSDRHSIFKPTSGSQHAVTWRGRVCADSTTTHSYDECADEDHPGNDQRYTLELMQRRSFSVIKAMQDYARPRSVNYVDMSHMDPMQETSIKGFLLFIQDLGVWSLLHQADPMRILESPMI